jgi:hypothetical protein
MKMSELKTKDPAMYNALKAKKDKKKEAKRNALAALIAFAAKSEDPAIKAAVTALTARAASGGRVAGTPSFITVLADMFKDKAFIHEDDVFKRARLGRKEMRDMTVKAIKNAKPEERIWVSFDLQSGIYKLEGKGPNAPANWKGYRPLVVDGKEVK